MRIVVTLIWIAALWLLAVGRPILAHELPPTEVEVQFQGDELTLIIPLAFEELIADMMVQMDPNADTMAVADQFDQLLTSDANALIAAFAPYADPFIHDFVILSGNQRFQADIIDYQIPVPNADATPRRSVIIAQTRIPSNIDAVQIGWGAENGDLAISYPPTGQFDYLVQGALSNPIALRDPSGSARLDAWQFIYSGFVHIIPRGTDHIIFILGLFFYSLSFLSLVKQATVFTVAHSITLLLASIGVINISPGIVEPLIALSIVFIGIENLRPKSRGRSLCDMRLSSSLASSMD